ncbi:MAG: hypothetical protein DGJ47_000738, partial [Rickettsiaceae bacterium]
MKQHQQEYTLDIQELWNVVNNDLMSYYGKDLYNNWLGKLDLLEIQNDKQAILAAPSDFVRDWIKSNYLNVISRCFSERNPKINSVDIITHKVDKKKALTPPTTAIIDSSDQAVETAHNDNVFEFLDSRFTFDNFVVGPPNELAYAAAMAVAESDS